MDVSMDQPQQHWLGEQEGQGFCVEFSHFLSMSQGNLSTGIDKKNIRRQRISICYVLFSLTHNNKTKLSKIQFFNIDIFQLFFWMETTAQVAP